METLQDSSEMAGPPKSVMSSGLTDSAALQGLEGYQIFLKWKQIKKKKTWLENEKKQGPVFIKEFTTQVL